MKSLYIVLLCSSLVSSVAIAESHTGTGQPSIVVTFQDNLAVVQIQQEDAVAVGRTKMESDFATAPLDAFTDQGVEANWGQIELLKHCESTDVILYQTIDGVQQETWVETIAMQNC
jgi:hypothetical protein